MGIPSDSSSIVSVKAREILDSRGNPTVEAHVTTASGATGIASTPSGASTGKHEVVELRDIENKRYLGKGVLGAIKNINEKIAPILVGVACSNQDELDTIMREADGTPDLSVLGGNAITAVSIACAKAAAQTQDHSLYEHIALLFSKSKNVSTPLPLMNIVNGGKHAGNGLAIQEFMIAPIGAKSLSESIRIASEIYHNLGLLLASKLGKSAINIGDEGGFAPQIHSTETVLNYILEATNISGYQLGNDIVIGIDCAATNFWNYDVQKYEIDSKFYSSDELINYYRLLSDQFCVKIIEDPFKEDDNLSYANITSTLGNRICIVGDDIFVTNKKRVTNGIEESNANAIIIKVNQVGTLTGAMEAIKSASSARWGIIASHRSGETTDDWLADFSVGVCADAIKAGAPSRGERVAKYNRLMFIEQAERNSQLALSGFKSDTLLRTSISHN
jgi:enolase